MLKIEGLQNGCGNALLDLNKFKFYN